VLPATQQSTENVGLPGQQQRKMQQWKMWYKTAAVKMQNRKKQEWKMWLQDEQIEKRQIRGQVAINCRLLSPNNYT